MKFRRNTGVKTPTKSHEKDSGWDLYSPGEFIVKSSSMSERINLGVGFEIPEGYCGFVMERSSQGKKGIHAIGPVVDCGYTGDVHVTLVNNGSEDYAVHEGDRISQLVVLAVYTGSLEETDVLEGERGNKGHGSTGV
jgi:dUTP pyrophosphatase